MKLIVGLGNPGSRYSKTRHNAGRLLVEYLASQANTEFDSLKKLHSFAATLLIESEKVVVAYPDVFMNQSGEPVLELVKFFEVNPVKDLLIAVDDVAIPFASLRMRARGSDGGHNGLKSIEESLGTADYPRLRIGVGPQNPEAGYGNLEEYVLENFLTEEEKAFPEVLRRGLEACVLWADEGIDRAMNAVNA
jgi:PTH1 family peptidyl-tRNA hydrolase